MNDGTQGHPGPSDPDVIPHSYSGSWGQDGKQEQASLELIIEGEKH